MPVITISRMFGSGGSEVAARVADGLGWTVLDNAVARGPVVLVGRGAQSYLAQRTDALHVFCYASRPALIARVVRREGITAEEAAKRVDETNKRREQYVRRYWQRSWHAPLEEFGHLHQLR